MTPRRVVITGAAGYLGEFVARRCVADGLEVLGLDVQEASASWPATAELRHQDVTDASLLEVVRAFRPDVLVHLAWVFDPTHDRRLERRVDIVGTANALRAAVAAGVGRVVYPSSTTAYGIEPGRRRPFVEDDPPRPNRAYPYAYYKARVEQWLPGFRASHPEIELIVLRPCIVIGPRARNIVTRIVEAPLMVRVAGYDPPLQLLHEQDAEEMMWRAMVDAPPGVYNVAGDGVILYSRVCRAAGRLPTPLPAAVLYPLVATGWHLGALPFPPGLLAYIRHPWVADTARIKERFGWRPHYSTRAALASYLESRPSP